MKSPRLVAVAFLAIFVLAACSSSGTASTAAGTPTAAASTAAGASTAPSSGATATTPAAPGASVDTCGLLSQADLKTVTGKDYGAGVGELGQCVWRVGGAKANNGKGQVIADLLAQPLSVIKSMFAGGVDVTVSGHPGYWNPGQGLQSMWVDVGGRLLVLSLDPVDSDSQGVAQKLAEIAVGRM